MPTEQMRRAVAVVHLGEIIRWLADNAGMVVTDSIVTVAKKHHMAFMFMTMLQRRRASIICAAPTMTIAVRRMEGGRPLQTVFFKWSLKYSDTAPA